MLFKFIKSPLIFLGVCSINLGLSTNAQAIGLALGDSASIPYSPVLEDTNLSVTGTNLEQDDENGVTFSCISPQGTEESESPAANEVSTLASVLVAQNIDAALDSFFGSAPITSDVCGIQQAGVGGAGAGSISPFAFTPLGALALLFGGDSGSNGSELPILVPPSKAAPSNLNEMVSSVMKAQPIKSIKDPVIIDDPSNVENVPEPMTILGTGLALGTGFILERKRRKQTHD